MRYYSIVLTKPDGTPYYFKSLKGQALTSLLPQGPQTPQNGLTNRAALNIELDIPVCNITDPDSKSGAFLRVWGLGLEDIGNAANLMGLGISIYAGMAQGLPLANPAQAGLIVQGGILQSFGNWVGTEQTVDMVIVPLGLDFGSPSSPANYPFNWSAGTQLAEAIAATLAAATVGVGTAISISSNLISNYDQAGHYDSISQFGDAMKELAQGILGSDYPGLTMATNGSTITVHDGTAAPKSVKAISVNDLIGQPTWIDSNVISVKMVLRSDIYIGDTISLPPTLFTSNVINNVVTRGNSKSQNLTFSGNFDIVQVHHYGSFRQPDAASWNTTFQANARVT